MIVTSKVNNAITAEVEVTSTYVPATSIKPAISGKKSFTEEMPTTRISMPSSRITVA